MKANIFSSIGKYTLFLGQVFRKPEKRSMLRKQFIIETDRLVMSSIVIVGVISLFMGGVLVIQTASNMENPFLDRMLIGYMVRESMILEFSSTMQSRLFLRAFHGFPSECQRQSGRCR